MRATLGTHWMVACALALGACAMDDTPVDNSPKDKTATVDSSAASASTFAEPSPVTIPDELSFENLPDVMIAGGDEDHHHHHHCHVKMFCHGGHHHDVYGGHDGHDDHHHHPSYCTYGDCWDDDEYENTAQEKCYHECDYADCDDLWYQGKCYHDHDHDHAPDTSQT